MRRLAIITARGGSKGLPDKNMLMVNGRPLLAYSIEAALNAEVFERIVLTTDSEEYIEELGHYPIDFHRRPDHLASDQATSFDAIQDVLTRPQYEGFDYFVLLQPTNPMRTAEHTRAICQAFDKQIDRYDFSASVTRSHKPTVLIRPIDSDETMKYWDIDYSTYRRQNYLPEFEPNGVFFVAKPTAYLEQGHFYGAKSMPFYMDKRSSIDIDDRDDFEHFYFLQQQLCKDKILERQFLRDLGLRLTNFSEQADITFIGDAHLAQWPRQTIAGKSIQNISFITATTEQYLKHIITPQILQHIAPIVVVSFGINDIRQQSESTEDIMARIACITEAIRRQTPESRIILLECPLTHFRVDCSNDDIRNLNERLRTYAETHRLPFVYLNDRIVNKYRKLHARYTSDGLNLNEAGYAVVEDALSTAMATI